MNIRNFLFFTVLSLLSCTVFAQHHHETGAPEETNPASEFFGTQAAGTAVSPANSAPRMAMQSLDKWILMAHGYAFLNFIEQSGPRGDDDVFSTNHLMLMAERQPNRTSSFLVRAMFSLEPGTTSNGMYPLLFQTGETADGLPIIDGQHPHDLFMELSAQYAIQLNDNMLLHFYAGIRGDPALGPVAYPHRPSAQELPQAALSHHLQDSTHIADDVLTAGVRYKNIRWEVSGFHGAEPDEHRWDLDQGRIDSWSTRLTFTFSPAWAAQLSTGRLEKPEELEPGDIQRTTASIMNHRTLADGFLSSSFIWGWNYKIAEDLDVHSFLFETLWNFRHANYLTARVEIVDKEELFAGSVEKRFNDLADEVFTIKAFTFGYARDIHAIRGFPIGAGANVSFYGTPEALDPFYGSNPKGFFFYLRIRGGQHGHAPM